LGGNATVRKHGVAHMAAIGRKGWYALVTKRFGGDYTRAGMWLSRHGLRAQDPFPENGAWQTVPPIDPQPAGQPGPTYSAKIPWYEAVMQLATTVTYTRTIQMSATSTATVTATMTAEPEPGDDYSSPEEVAAITALLWPLGLIKV
jgi:hypothetical protein